MVKHTAPMLEAPPSLLQLPTFIARHHAQQPRHLIRPSIKGIVSVVALGTVVLLLCVIKTESTYLRPPPSKLFTQVFPDPNVAEMKPGSCEPDLVVMSHAVYSSVDPFYNRLRAMAPLPAPTFQGSHVQFCNATGHELTQYDYCLPISGRDDDEHCGKADRMDLLTGQSPRDICHASVLHMLMVDVYEEIRAVGARPLIAFGTLLGAVRNQSMIPFTEDVDIAYINLTDSRRTQLREQLWVKGYHMFFFDIWRVCVAPTHPLASNIYDSDMSARAGFDLPYADLYPMHHENTSEWSLRSTKSGWRLPDSVVRPFGTAEINGVGYDTVHDPATFLSHEYGDDFMVPRPRRKNVE